AQGPMDINEVLSYLTPADGNILKSQTGTALFYESQNLWAGSFTQMDNKKMYRIYLDEADVLYYPGKVVDPLNSPINIYPGWNHIGYPVQGNIFINTALSSLNSVLQTGDIIKSQYGYAEYVAGQGWFGSLKFLEPGIGYMLKSSGNATLYYPAQASTNARTIQNNENLKM